MSTCQKKFFRKSKPLLKNYYCSSVCVAKSRTVEHMSEEARIKRSKSLSGKNNPFYGKKHTESTLEKLRKINSISYEERYGKEKADKIKKKICKPGKDNPFYGKKHTKETRKKMSTTKTKMILEGSWHPLHCRGHKGHHFSLKNNTKFFYESLYELIRMISLDRDENVISWKKNSSVKISYTLNNNKHYYIPDFIIEEKDRVIIEEVKGYEDMNKLQEKINALKNYCKNNDFTASVLYYNDIDKICREFLGVSYTAFSRSYNKKNEKFN